MRRTRYDIPLRALTAAVVVAVVTTASHEIGSFVSGMFAVFPIVMGSFVVILHPRVGGPAAASVFAHAQVPLVGLGWASWRCTTWPSRSARGGRWLVGLAVCVAWNATAAVVVKTRAQA